LTTADNCCILPCMTHWSNEMNQKTKKIITDLICWSEEYLEGLVLELEHGDMDCEDEERLSSLIEQVTQSIEEAKDHLSTSTKR